MKMNTETYGLIAIVCMAVAMIFAILYGISDHRDRALRSEKFWKEYNEKEKIIQKNSIEYDTAIMAEKLSDKQLDVLINEHIVVTDKLLLQNDVLMAERNKRHLK